jgi:DnaK suppressor protein
LKALQLLKNDIFSTLQPIIIVLSVCFFENYKSTDRVIMKKKDIEYFRNLMTDQLEALLNQADDTVSGMTTPKENFPDPTDRASLEAERNFMLRIRDRESKLIKKIKKTLARIDKSTFGICDKCGDDIAIERLKARPVTTQCIECKTKEEALEKALGL